MKNFTLLVVAFVAIFGFVACDKHECNDYDHSQDLVGTWTCLQADFAEALVIKADGTAVSTGVHDGEYWENVAGRIVVENGKVIMEFEDDDDFEGHFDIIPGMAFSIYTDEGDRFTYDYCKEDLSDEIVGMWVATEGNSVKGLKDMVIQTYRNDGTSLFTGTVLPDVTGITTPGGDGYMLNNESIYKVVGDLLIRKDRKYVAMKLNYTPKGTSLGDIMTTTTYLTTGDKVVTAVSSYLRIKQTLDLAGKKYDYANTYVSNVKGSDKEVDFLGQMVSFADMDGVLMDKMLKTLLFRVEFPDADHIMYSCHYNNSAEPAVVKAPVTVDGNKMTVRISEVYQGFRNIDIYTFQDQDNTQMHMYMPVKSFENFLANTAVEMLANEGKLDLNDAAAVKAIFDQVEAAIETINVSFIFKTAK